MILGTSYNKLVEISKKGKFHIVLDGKPVDLELNKHYRLPF